MRRAIWIPVALAPILTSLSAAAWPGPERRPAPDGWPDDPVKSECPATRQADPDVRWYRGEPEPGDLASNPPVDVDWRALEADVLREMNLFRKDPAAYATKLVELRQRMRGNLIERPGQAPIATQEGVAAVDEAIAALRRGPRRLPRLAPSRGLTAAAADHARDLGRVNGLGHAGSDGSSPEDRISRHGRWDVMVAENIAFGPTTGEEVIVGLLVDDGVPDRGHRKVLFERDLFFTGVACGPHPSYGATCVIDYASAFESGRARPARDPYEDDEAERYDDGRPSRWRTTPGPR